MKFPTKEDVTDDWGPPDPALPNWNDDPLRRRGPRGRPRLEHLAQRRRRQLHPGRELRHGHLRPRVQPHPGHRRQLQQPVRVPARRAYTGPWEMLSRGTFNGPGGPHSRWLIPATAGGSMGAQHMLRNKIKLGIVDPSNVLNLTRDGVAGSGRRGGQGEGPRGAGQTRRADRRQPGDG